MKIILYSLLILFLLNLNYSVFSQKIPCKLEIDKNLNNENIDGFFSVFGAISDLTPEQAYDSLGLSLQTDYCTSNTSPGFINKKYWVSFDLKNISNISLNLLLEVNNPHIDTIIIYSKSDSSNIFIKEAMSGDQMPFKNRVIDNRRFIFPIELNVESEKTILVLIDKRTGATSFPMKIWSEEKFYESESLSKLFHSAYFGGLLFVSILSFIIGLLVRNMRISLYGLYVFAMGLLIFTALGYSFEYLYPWSATFNNYSRTFILLLTYGLFILFSLSFLNIKKHLKAVYWILTAVYSFCFVLAFSNFVFLDFLYSHIYGLLNSIYIIMFIGFLALLFSILKIIKIERQTAVIYIFALLALFVGGFISILIEIGLIDENYFQYADAILLGSVVEILIFSLSFILEIKTIYEKKNQLLLEKSAQQKQLVEAYINGTEEEGLRISKELHDNIGSRLALIKSGLESYVQDLPKLKNELNSVFADVKQISNALSPNQLQILGFQEAVKCLVLQLQEIDNVEVSYYSEDLPHIEHDTQLQLYRIIQEVIQNIVKHSQATEVDFQMVNEEVEGAFIILIDDNGKGFDKSKVNAKNMGLNNMQLRAEAVNSRIEISSKENEGTHIVLWCDNYTEVKD